jgi:transcriptional regulator with XRE-family HTH domain
MEMFVDRLERLLKENHLSQSALADMVQIRRPTISDWKKNGSFPTADVAVRIAKALHTTVEYLVTGEQNDPEAKLNELKKKVLEFAQSVQ